MAPDETPEGKEHISSGAVPLVPVSAEDFARGKRRIVLAWVAGALLVILLAVWIYRRSVDPLAAQQAVDAGARFLKATRYTEAILAFDRAISLKKDLPDAYLMRGRANVALSQLEPAIQDFSRVIQLRPNSPDAFMDRAGARLAQKDYQAVIADCGDAIGRDPRLAYAYTLRGMAFRETGNLSKSLEDLTRAVELSPGVDNYFQRGATYQNAGEHQRAIADLDQVISLLPASPMGYLARAKSREALGDLAGASKDREEGRLLAGRPNH